VNLKFCDYPSTLTKPVSSQSMGSQSATVESQFGIVKHSQKLCPTVCFCIFWLLPIRPKEGLMLSNIDLLFHEDAHHSTRLLLLTLKSI